MDIHLLGDNVLIQQSEAEPTSDGGLILPDLAKKNPPPLGTVIAVGEGRKLKSGRVVPLSISIGDTIVFEPTKGTNVKIGNEMYQIFKEDHILAVLD